MPSSEPDFDTIEKVMSAFAGDVKEEFQKEERVLSFHSFLEHFQKKPYLLSRNAAAYLVDMMDSFGTYEVDTPLGRIPRFKLFDLPFEDVSLPRLVGHEEVQWKFYSVVRSFLQEGHINKLVLLHGPNGSAKSSFFRCLIAGMEAYSRTGDGLMYSFNWIFPEENVYKKSIGLGSSSKSGYLDGPLESYAQLDPEKISTIISNEMKDNPLFLLPYEQRKKFLKMCRESVKDEEQLKRFDKMAQQLIEGSLSDKSNQIFEALLTAYKGDFNKVLMHIQVERVFMSKRFQTGAVTVDPQMNVDAQARQVTMNRSLAYIPSALQSLNLFSLDGPLIQANRGIIEFNDLLKRPVEAFKYLLGTCETSMVHVGPSLAYLDQVMAGTCNEVQMEAFREYPDFPSFRARMEFVQVPYLLRYSQEKDIYNQVIGGYAGDKHVSPYTTETLALWAVLTRIRKPQLAKAAAPLKRIIDSLSALEKAKLYDHNEIPSRFTSEEAKEVRAQLPGLWKEFQRASGYEGRFGASAREMKMILYNASHDDAWECVSTGKIVEELERFVQRKAEYEFLRQEPAGGFHAHADFVEVVSDYFLNLADRDFKLAMGLAEESQYPKILERYANHVKAHLRQEKVENELTGKPMDPDMNLLTKTEGMLDINKDRDQFRKDMITAIAAWAHDHPGIDLDYEAIFPEYIKRIKNHFHEEQRKVVEANLQAILDTEQKDQALDAKHIEQTKKTVEKLKKDFGYCSICIEEAASLLLKQRYA